MVSRTRRRALAALTRYRRWTRRTQDSPATRRSSATIHTRTQQSYVIALYSGAGALRGANRCTSESCCCRYTRISASSSAEEKGPQAWREGQGESRRKPWGGRRPVDGRSLAKNGKHFARTAERDGGRSGSILPESGRASAQCASRGRRTSGDQREPMAARCL